MGYRHEYSPRSSPTRGDYLVRRKFSRRLRTGVIAVLLLCCLYTMVNMANVLPSTTPPPPRETQEYHSMPKAPSTPTSDQTAVSDVSAKPGAKVGKVSMLYGDPSPHYERAMQSHAVHAEQHGYPFSILRAELIDGIWSKPAYIMQLVMEELQKPADERLEWLFWADADTYVVNPLVPLEVFLPPPSMDHIQMLVGNDHNGLNFGVFFIRISSWTLRFMSDVLALRHYQPDLKLRFNEQSAVAHLLNTTQVYSSAAAIIPQRWVNAYMGPRHWDGRIREGGTSKSNSVVEGDLLIHFAGHSGQKKTRMTLFMDKQEELKDVWQIEYEKTRYPKEIARFWRKFGTSSEEENKAREDEEVDNKVKEVAADKQEQKKIKEEEPLEEEEAPIEDKPVDEKPVEEDKAVEEEKPVGAEKSLDEELSSPSESSSESNTEDTRKESENDNEEEV